MTARCRPLGVSTVEAHLLGYCQGKGPCPISELQRVLGERKSTLTAILDRLESRKLIARRPNPSDRRSWIVAVTPEGNSLASKLRREYEAFESQLTGGIRPRDLAGFEAVMHEIGRVTNVQVPDAKAKPARN